ncbi:DUF5949 family protein [Streptomyces sp. NPDC052107]|uniref:DUF5949 family protein n=1 Tax=Streptomyces sp. NPDC052107 TaxID=3155632 RepID=UPI003441AEBB
MTSTSSAILSSRPTDLGTIVVLAWSGEAPGGDMPYLLAYPLGDAEGGPEASSSAVRRLLESNGLPVGGDLVDGFAQSGLPVSLLVGAGQAVVSMAQLKAQCPAPREWLEAVGVRGFAYFVFTTRLWPEAVPGRHVDPAALAAFAGAEETLKQAAHLVLPVRSLRG